MQKYGRGLFSRLQFSAAAAIVLSVILLIGLPIIAKAEEEEDASKEMVREMGYALKSLADERDIMGVVYLCTEYSLRRSPSQESNTAMQVPCGQTVMIQGSDTDAQGTLWLKVRAQVGTLEGEGWIERKYLACSDERFLAWEGFLTNQISLLVESGEPEVRPELGGEKDTDSGSEIPADILMFPKSYQKALIALKEAHPNWIFVPMNTGLDWNETITEELKDGKSLVYRSFPECTKEGAYDQGNWYYASREVLEHYMDPRNSLTENTIFQYEQLTYNESYHTQRALKAFLDKTFMNSSKKAPGTSMTYDLIIWSVGREKEVSPFHLAARIYQEQGRGDSPLISGTYPGYEGYYNYFNIGASGTTNREVIENGLAFAKKQGWKDAYFSILGGADFISGNYIKRGQDTLYLQKYNVNPGSASPLYTHQYMQNISAPTTEASKIRELYHSADALTSPFVFKIPTFMNMPKKACPMPESSTNVVLEIPSGYTGTEMIVDGTALEAERRNGRLIATLPDANAKKALVQIRDAEGKIVETYCWNLTYVNNCYTATPTPAVAMYQVVFKGNGATGGTMSALTNCEVGESYTLPANGFTRTGYTFTGWNKKADGTGTAYADKASVKNLTKTNGATVTLYAQWKKNSYSIAFKGNGATEGEMKKLTNCEVGENYTLPANGFIRTGYTFTGWNKKADGTGTAYADKASVKNLTKTNGATVTLYAQWKKNSYSIAFKGNGATGGTMSALTNCEVGESYTLPANGFTRTGYTFTGWNKKADGTGTAYADKASVKDLTKTNGATVTLYAQWKKNSAVTYQIKFNGNGGTGMMSALKCKTGKSYQLPANAFKKQGYSFAGWNTKKDGTGKSFKNKASVKDLTKKSGATVTLYAQWKPKSYTVKFDGNKATSGQMEDMENCRYDESFQLTKSAYKRKGYTFAGWNTEKNGTGKFYKNRAKVKNLTAKNKGTVVLYAQWIKK